MKQATIIKRLQARALVNYNNGWDAFVECYEHSDWVKFTTHHTGAPMTWREALDIAETCARHARERQADAAIYREDFIKAETVEAPADDVDDSEPDDAPHERLEFIPHAGDYSRFD